MARGRGRRGAAVALATALVVLATTGSGPAAAVPAPADAQVGHPLRATHGAGARIVDDLGRTVILRGVNVNGLGEYYQELPDLPSTEPLTEDDFAAIAARGFDVVRLIVTWSRLEPQPGVIDAAYLDRIAQAVGWARAHDVYVLLDMHQDAWGPAVGTPDGVACPPPLEAAVGWDGAPAWATALVGTVATCRLALREVSAAVQASFQAFYLDLGGVQAHLVQTWAALAGRFAADPTVAGYDLLNEPNPGLAVGVDDLTLLGAFYGRVLPAIRSAEQTAPGGFGHLGLFEPSVLTGPLSVPGPLPGFSGDANLVYAPHLYNESISPLPGTIEDGFANAATAADRFGTPFLSGEWGWFGDPAADAALIARYAANEDRHLIGGTWWQWEQACGDPHNIQLRGHRPACADTGRAPGGLVAAPASTTRILDRAYPRAAPGRLTSIQADVASGGLVVTGQADRAGVPADLWVPARCLAPSVSGTGVGAATSRAVPGGWRVGVPVPAAGDYRIAVACAPPATAAIPPTTVAHAGASLPATGGGRPVALPAALALALAGLALGVAARRVGNFS